MIVALNKIGNIISLAFISEFTVPKFTYTHT